jgi:hypothetical protein
MTVPKPGDVIYVDSELHVWHGVDDFRGGKATVSAVRMGDGEESAQIEIVEDPGTWYTWAFLAPKQANLAAKFGRERAHPHPDLRPEFNDDVEGWT